MARMIKRLQVSLSLVLQTARIEDLSHAVLYAALWSLSVEAVASAAGMGDSRALFRSYKVRICDALGLERWLDFEVVLRKYLWPLSWEVHGQAIWSDVSAFREARSMSAQGGYA